MRVFLSVMTPQFACLKSLVEVSGIFMDFFVMLMIVLYDFYTLNAEITHENPVYLPCGLRIVVI